MTRRRNATPARVGRRRSRSPAAQPWLESAMAAPRVAANEADAASSLYFPPATGKWKTVTPAQAGWDAKALDAALTYAGEQRSSGVVILHRGRILAERYWELPPSPTDPNDRVHRMTTGRTADGQAIEDVASMQKSVMSFLAGVARGKGLLDFDAPVSRYLGAGWSKATPEQEAAITVRHVLGMTSGLATRRQLRGAAGHQVALQHADLRQERPDRGEGERPIRRGVHQAVAHRSASACATASGRRGLGSTSPPRSQPAPAWATPSASRPARGMPRASGS